MVLFVVVLALGAALYLALGDSISFYAKL